MALLSLNISHPGTACENRPHCDHGRRDGASWVTGPAAEFNIYVDPEAAKLSSVRHSGGGDGRAGRHS
ncbi:hypothetical protein KCP69_21300 [Salmonella enterica subsp. enterica]|nr:hypothetical protein KCP69_21300 [Salmonella enterica subsp. enterica]